MKKGVQEEPKNSQHFQRTHKLTHTKKEGKELTATSHASFVLLRPRPHRPRGRRSWVCVQTAPDWANPYVCSSILGHHQRVDIKNKKSVGHRSIGLEAAATKPRASIRPSPIGGCVWRKNFYSAPTVWFTGLWHAAAAKLLLLHREGGGEERERSLLFLPQDP